MTVKIEIKQHLAEYAIGKYYDRDKKCVRFPDSLDIYHTLHDLLQRRPVNTPVDLGNLEIFLPEKRIGKSTYTYNYLGERAIRLMQSKIETMFWAELHDLLDHNKHIHAVEYIDTCFTFMQRYGILSISEDGLLKNYYRWRENVRKRDRRRSYNKQTKKH